MGLPDGSLIFTETQANRITRIDKDSGATTTFLENTNGSNGLGLDAKGRLISVQTVPGQTRIGVIYPKGSVATLTDNFEGKPYGRPNDLVVAKNGGVYFSEPGPNADAGPAADRAAAAAGRVLHLARRQGGARRRGHRAPQRRDAQRRREDALRQQHQRRVPAGLRREARRLGRRPPQLRQVPRR